MQYLKTSSWTAALLGASIAAGVLGAALPGMAQKKDAGKPKASSVVGYVDLNTISEQVKQTADWKQMVQQIEGKKTGFKSELEDMNRLRYLTAAQREELKNLRAKPKASDNEQGRIKELESLSDKLEGEFRTLAGVEGPSAEQTNRLKELQKLREEGVSSLQTETEKRAGEIEKLQGDFLEKTQKRIIDVVEKVAESKGLDMVVDKVAILYGGQDLTEDVVKRLK